MNENNNVLKQLKPIKIMKNNEGMEGTQSTVIEVHDENYVVKIHHSNVKKINMFKKILEFLQNRDMMPETIYESYINEERLNSKQKYRNKNKFPNHFTIIDEENYKKLKRKYGNVRNYLFEIIKRYNLSLKTFTNSLNRNSLVHNQDKIKIKLSLIKQGVLTLLWLYINKSIVHNDIVVNNFFVEETKSTLLNIKIYGINYKVITYGYYLVVYDFGRATSMELLDYEKYKNNEGIKINIDYIYFDPLSDIIEFIEIMSKLLGLSIDLTEIKKILNNEYKEKIEELVKKYRENNSTLPLLLSIFKIELFKYVNEYILMSTLNI